MRKIGPRVVLGLLLALDVLAGSRGAAASQPAAESSIGRAIRIYSPYAGGPAIAGNHLLVQVSIAEYRLDGTTINQPGSPDAGYWTLTVDGIFAGLAVSDMTMAPNAALPRLRAGPHRIRVELVSSLGAPLAPPVYDEETVTLANDMVFDPGSGGLPAVTIILPAGGAQVPPDHLYVKVRLANFRPDARQIGRPPQPGVGTWWLAVDGAFAGLSMSEILDLPNDALPRLAPGPHTLTASLHGNDGTLVPGAATSSVQITVPGCNDCPTDPLPPTPPPTPDPGMTADCAGGGTLFPETGHRVCPQFLAWWTRYGGLAQFGYPITDLLQEPDPASEVTYQVQYFQRARFEYHPENAGTPDEVLLGRLGARIHPPDPAVPAPAEPGLTYFPATGHTLSGRFAAYWQTHGGLFVNGYPISEVVNERSPTDGRVYPVQYFERARFELHPGVEGAPPQVLLGLLGVQVARQAGLLP